MRALTIGIITVVAIVIVKIKKKYCFPVMIAFASVLIALNVYYNFTTLSKILDFFRPFSQTFYYAENVNDGLFPDALLIDLLKGKTVYTKDDPYQLYMAEMEGKSFHYAYYHAKNAQNFIEFAGGKLVKDEAMNGTMVVNEKIATDFCDLGMANDMFRYTFMINSMEEEMGNYFTYYWYYYEYLKDIHVYLCNNDECGNVFEEKELVLLWDSPKDKEEENYYLMTKNYYETVVKSNLRNEE